MSFIPGNTGVASSFPDGFLVADGSVTAPTFKFSDTQTGFYRPGTNQWALASAGVQTWSVSATGAHTFGPVSGLSSSHSMRASLGIADAGPGTNTPVFQISNNSQTVNTDASPAYLQFSSGNSGTGVATIGGVRTGINSAKLVFGTHNSGIFLTAGEVAPNGAWTLGPSTADADHKANGNFEVILSTSNTDYLTSVAAPAWRMSNASTVPVLSGMCTNSAGSVYLIGATDAGNDIGTAGVLRLDARRRTASNAGSGIATRPIIEFTNNDVVMGAISAGGAWTIGSAAGGTIHLVRANGNGAGSAAMQFYKTAIAANTSGQSYLEFFASGPTLDGYLGVLGTTLQVVDSSDSRKKQNVRDADYGLAEVLALRPVVYDWKPEFGGALDVKGFLAQEVEAVLPECVDVRDESADGGFVDSRYLGTATMIPVLVKAIQEQQAQIEALAARIITLEGA